MNTKMARSAPIQIPIPAAAHTKSAYWEELSCSPPAHPTYLPSELDVLEALFSLHPVEHVVRRNVHIQDAQCSVWECANLMRQALQSYPRSRTQDLEINPSDDVGTATTFSGHDNSQAQQRPRYRSFSTMVGGVLEGRRSSTTSIAECASPKSFQLKSMCKEDEVKMLIGKASQAAIKVAVHANRAHNICLQREVQDFRLSLRMLCKLGVMVSDTARVLSGVGRPHGLQDDMFTKGGASTFWVASVHLMISALQVMDMMLNELTGEGEPNVETRRRLTMREEALIESMEEQRAGAKLVFQANQAMLCVAGLEKYVAECYHTFGARNNTVLPESIKRPMVLDVVRASSALVQAVSGRTVDLGDHTQLVQATMHLHDMAQAHVTRMSHQEGGEVIGEPLAAEVAMWEDVTGVIALELKSFLGAEMMEMTRRQVVRKFPPMCLTTVPGLVRDYLRESDETCAYVDTHPTEAVVEWLSCNLTELLQRGYLTACSQSDDDVRPANRIASSLQSLLSMHSLTDMGALGLGTGGGRRYAFAFSAAQEVYKDIFVQSD